MKNIPTPKISEILKQDFMSPQNISAYTLAKQTDLPASHIQEILQDHCRITTDVSARLGHFFNVSDKYFLNLQNDIDSRNTNTKF